MSPWEVASEPWADAKREPMPTRRAEEFLDLYSKAGMSLRQVGDATGVSREEVRRQLHRIGATLRPRHEPHNRIEIRRDEEGRVKYGYEVSLAKIVRGGPRVIVPDGPPLWRMDLFAAPAIRGVLVELGMFDGGEGTPPISKLETQDGWHLTPSECAAAVREWRSRSAGWATDAEVSRRVAVLVRLICEDGGWEPTRSEVDRRVRHFVELVAVLQVGADGAGLVVT